MIIGRISKGIENQDWFVVMVEVMIVVVGIFIGLQVDDWNEERKNDMWTQVFLKDLKSELSSNEAQLDRVIISQQEKEKTIEQLYILLKDREQLDREKINELYFSYQSVHPTFFPSQGVYMSALSSGKLELLENTQLKYEIMNLYERDFKRLVYNGEIYDENVSKVDWDRRSYFNAVDGEIFKWDGISGGEFSSHVQYLFRSNIRYNNIGENIQTNINDMIKRIEAELKGASS